MATTKWKRWGKRLGVTAGVLFVLYVVGGFWGVPLVLRYYALPKLNEEVAGHAEVEAFYSNPFTWQLTVKGLKGFTPDGSEAASVAEFRVNVQPTSAFSEEKAIKEIYIDRPFLNLIIDEDGKINIISSLERLREEAEKEASSDEPFVIPQIHIGSLKVLNAGLRTQIDSFGRPFVREIEDLSFTMEDVHTLSSHDNPYSFHLLTTDGEKIQVNGDLRLDPLSSWGQVVVEQLDLKDFDVFAGDQVGFDLTDGVVDLSVGYRFMPLGDTPRMEAYDGNFTLTNMRMVARDDPEHPFEQIDKMHIRGAKMDLLNNLVACDYFSIEGGLLKVVREKDGVLNLMRYIATSERQAEIAAEAEREAKSEGNERQIRLGVVSADLDMGVALTSAWNQIQQLVELNWDLEVGTVDLSGLSLTWRDEYLPTPAELRWTDIAMQADKLNNGDKAFPYKLSLVMNDTGKVALNGSFTATPASTEFEVQAETIPLQVISPYVTNVVDVDLISGDLSASGQTAIALPDNALPVLSAEVNAQLANLEIDWTDPASKLISWQNVDLQGVSVSTEPMALVASQVTVTNPVLAVERLPDGSFRLPLPKEKEATPAETAPSPEPDSAQPEIDYHEASVQLVELVIENGELQITDQAVSPAMQFNVTNAQLRAGPLSYPNVEPTKFDLAITLSNGPSGGVKVAGALDPLQPFAATEVSVNTTGVPLSPFAAYAVPIIGRPPTSGKLTANLGYSITTGEIVGSNKMQIQQVRFGERAKDSQAPNLPLELGVAILEDSKGVMHIDVPVKGNINDPEFSLDHMISYAIGNVLEKLVTAPFAALGSLLPGDESVGNAIAFQPGKSTLPPEGLEVATNLVTILADRPNLLLTLTPSVDPETDSSALRDLKFQAMLQARMEAESDDAEDATEDLYDALPKTEATPDASDLTLTQQQDAIKETIEITTQDFADLAQARASAVLTALTQSGLPPERVKIITSDGSPYAQDGAKVDLGLDAAQ
ncbi:DUF748 domain-containing protein [Cerasicoccus frondis]|uniref:DUF748 domain-containing protein n=1 Tax=Cerasicoccus frondis TaxID=490090 RepID=UPI002852D79B|nr:DUF748 domain-containing protein [Cerasicoccus frondis]